MPPFNGRLPATTYEAFTRMFEAAERTNMSIGQAARRADGLINKEEASQISANLRDPVNNVMPTTTPAGLSARLMGGDHAGLNETVEERLLASGFAYSEIEDFEQAMNYINEHFDSIKHNRTIDDFVDADEAWIALGGQLP